MKALSSSGLVVIFWISSWFSVSAVDWSLYFAVGCTLGVVVAYLAKKPLKEIAWLSKAVSVLAIFVLIGGAYCTLVAGIRMISADGGITFFFVLGGVGYLCLIRDILSPSAPGRKLQDLPRAQLTTSVF